MTFESFLLIVTGLLAFATGSLIGARRNLVLHHDVVALAVHGSESPEISEIDMLEPFL
jgi:hypothetical protein